jgi:uncharacterized membrane protein YphA (DoxX/SURF4 family)
MNIVLWVAAGVLAVVFAGAGAMKLMRGRDELVASGQGWAGDVPIGLVKAIGAAEVLGAIGLVLPPLVDVAPVLVPIAAIGLAVVMLGAVTVHTRRREPANAAFALVLAAISVFVVIGRLGIEPF